MKNSQDSRDVVMISRGALIGIIVAAVFVVGLLVGILLPRLIDKGTNQPVQQAPATIATAPVATAPTPQPAPSTTYIDYDNMPTQNKGRWPETSFYLLSTSDLYGLSLDELEIMRNEIYARHGYIFKSDKLRRHFARQSWYRGYTSDSKAVAENFSEVERKNVQTIKDYERYLKGR